MASFALLGQTLRVFGAHLGSALRLSALAMALGLGLLVLLRFASGPGTPSLAGCLLSVAMAAYFILAMLWVNVAWMRHLLVATPARWLPAWHGGAALACLWRALVLALLFMLPAAVLGALFAAIGRFLPEGGGPKFLHAHPVFGAGAGAALDVLLIWIALRLGATIGAAALGEDLRFRDAWRATRRDRFRLIGFALMLRLGLPALHLPVPFLQASAPAAALVWLIALRWLTALYAFSLFAFLYRHYLGQKHIDQERSGPVGGAR